MNKKTEKEKPKFSKEIKEIQKAIEKYIKKHEGRVDIHGSFLAFDEDCKCVDGADLVFAYGIKESILISMEELLKETKKEKEDFINW